MDADSSLWLVHGDSAGGCGSGLGQAKTLLFRLEKETRGDTGREKFW